MQVTRFFICKLVVGFILLAIPGNYTDEGAMEYLCVFFIGSLLSAIELGSRYKDEPISVMVCIPGACYLIINGLICCVGLYFINVFGTNEIIGELPSNVTSDTGKQVVNILYASLGSFFVMRSSFLKLGSESSSSQIDLGLNIILKKLIDIIDRQVDRDQAVRRSNDITVILKDVSYDALLSRVHPFCLQLMQNVPIEESELLYKELESIKASDRSAESKKLAIGLQLYNIVGKKLLASIVEDLKLKTSLLGASASRSDEDDNFEDSFGDIVDEIKIRANTR